MNANYKWFGGFAYKFSSSSLFKAFLWKGQLIQLQVIDCNQEKLNQVDATKLMQPSDCNQEKLNQVYATKLMQPS